MKSRTLVIVLSIVSTPQIALADSGGSPTGWTRSVSYGVTDSLREGNAPEITDSRQDSKTITNGPFATSVSINQDLSSIEGSSVGTETHAKAISSFSKMGVAISGAAFANSAGFTGSTTAQATSTISDTLLFHSAAGSSPGPFTIHYRLELDGTSSAKALGAFSPNFPNLNNDYVDSYSSVMLFLSGTGINDGAPPRLLSRTTDQYANTAVAPPIDISAPGFIDGSAAMFEDIPTNFFLSMSIFGTASTANFDQKFHREGSASFDADYIHTLKLLPGIYFTDSDGNVVTNFTLSSASGFDYLHPQASNAVPEPSAWALMIAGFGLIGLTLRRGAAPEHLVRRVVIRRRSSLNAPKRQDRRQALRASRHFCRSGSEWPPLGREPIWR